MANITNKSAKNTTTKKQSTDEVAQATVQENQIVNETVIVDNEKEQLKNELAELKAKMEAQMALMAQMMSNAQSNVAPVAESKEEKYITFVNMTRGGFTLRGSSMYRIPEQFGYRRFLEREAQVIVNNMGNAIKQGYVYITDADFVEKNQLKDTYSNLLSDKQLEELLNKDSSYVVDVYKNVSEGQKSIILGMIENKKLNSEKIDANILMEIGKLANKDLINLEPIEDEEG